MTARREQREACFEAMEHAYLHRVAAEDWTFRDLIVACFDALNDIAFVCPIEATEEMHAAAAKEWDGRMSARSSGVWGAMATAGDLTNPPDRKP